MNATARLLFATAVLVLSATSASSSSQMAGTALIGLGAPAAPSVTTVAVANASNRVQLNGSMATDRANTGSVGQANVGAGPAKTKEGGSSAALRGDSSTEPPAYWLALAGFALVGFVAHRRKPD